MTNNKELNEAAHAVEAIPFSSWPNKEIKAVIYTLLAALAFEYDDMRQVTELAHAQQLLSGRLADSHARFTDSIRQDLTCMIYYSTGRLPDKEDPLISDVGQGLGLVRQRLEEKRTAFVSYEKTEGSLTP